MRRRPVVLAAFTAFAALTAGLVTGCGDDNEPDPLRGRQWALDALKPPDAWSAPKGEDTVIAVVDTGLDPAAIMQTIRDTAANPSQAPKLGLGNVDAAAAVNAAKGK